MTGNVTLYAKWTQNVPVDPDPVPVVPVIPSNPGDDTRTETKENEDGTTTTIVTDNRTGTVTETNTDAEGEVLAKVELPGEISEPETRFVDVPEGHWADEAIHSMAALEVVKGVGDDRYDMNSGTL